MKRAVEQVRRMRGGTQSQLMRCDDGGYYIVMFQNNPQGVRIRANELLATRLAARIGFGLEIVRAIFSELEMICPIEKNRNCGTEFCATSRI